MGNYDKYYKAEDFFGEPYPELIAFFREHGLKGTLLDLGCGQGRDSIPLSRIGYQVTGIDSSKEGIQQMLGKAKDENLNIKGLVQDLYEFSNYKDYDIVLLDSMFHFGKREKEAEKNLLIKIAENLKIDGLICICIQDTGSKAKIMKSTILESKSKFEVLNDSSLFYTWVDKESGHQSRTKYCMYIVKKTA